MEFNEAKEILIDKVELLETESIKIDCAFNRVLASDLISRKNVPSFNRSPLDGYCFNYEDTIGANSINPKYFDVIEEVPCGKVATKSIGKNQSIKILTGAKMPIGSNCVIKYEETSIENNKLKIERELGLNENVILVGEDVKEGCVLAKSGSSIDMGIVGIAASLGVTNLNVYKKIKIGLISTGSELLELNEPVTDCKIYNSNK